MSVLIKDMKMPENCDVCIFSDWSNLHQTAACKERRSDSMTDCEKKDHCDIDPDGKQEAKLKILFEELGFTTTEDDLDDDNPDKSTD